MPGPRLVAGLALLVLILAFLLVAAAAAVTCIGARRAGRAARLQADLEAGRADVVPLDLARRVVLDLVGSRTSGDLRRLLPADVLQQLRIQALTSLRARRWPVRLLAARVLAAVGPVEALVQLLDDPVPVVRAAACSGVGRGSDSCVLERVARLLADGDAGVRHAAGDALSRSGPQAAAALAALLAQPPPADVRAAALRLAAGPGADVLLPHADAAAADADPLIRAASTTALAAVGDPFGRLPRLLADEVPAVAAAACRAAGAVRDAALAAPLAAALRSPAWDVRTTAAEALTALGPPGVLVLQRTVQGEDAYARDAALAALGLAVPVDTR